MNKVRIITKVERTLCNNLNGLLRAGINSIKLPEGIQWDEVVCREHASLSTTEKVDDKVPVFGSTLKFYTCQDIQDHKNYAYRLRFADGSHLLLGTERRPFPVMTVQDSMPEKPSDNSWTEITVTWSSLYPPAQIVG